MLNSPQSPYFTPALKPQLDFPLKKTSQNKSGAALGVGMEREKMEDEVRKEEQDVGLSPSHACLLFAGAEAPPTPPAQFLHPALPYLVRHSRQGVRRSCNWNTDYMNNEPETTRMSRNRDQGLETIMNRQF